MRYLVKSTLIHNQRTYEDGDQVELNDEHAAPLIRINVIELAPSKRKATPESEQLAEQPAAQEAPAEPKEASKPKAK